MFGKNSQTQLLLVAVSAAAFTAAGDTGRVTGEGLGLCQGPHIETRTVYIHIEKLRRKIEPEPAQPRYLVTVRGAGRHRGRCGRNCTDLQAVLPFGKRTYPRDCWHRYRPGAGASAIPRHERAGGCRQPRTRCGVSGDHGHTLMPAQHKEN